MNPSATARILSQLWLITVVVLAVAVLYLAKVLLLPLGFAILFAFLLAPVVASLERLRLPRPIAALLVILSFSAILVVATWALFTQLVAIADDLPTYRDNIALKMQSLHSPSNSAYGRAQAELETLINDIGIANSTTGAALTPPGKAAQQPLGTSAENPVQVRVVGMPTGRLDQLGGIIEPATTALLSVVFTFFVLLQREDLRNRLIRLSGDRNLSLMTQAMGDASRRISRYFLLQVAVNFAYGLIVCVALYFIGLPHFLLFAAVAFISRFIPYIGAPIAALTPTLLSLAIFRDWSHSVCIFALFMVLELVTANYVEPHIYGKHTGLSSLAVLIAAAFWTLIWGPVGLILSVPLTVCLVVMGSHIPSLGFLHVLLGDQPVIPTYVAFYQRMLAHDEREAGEILDACLRTEPLVSVYDSILLPALTMVETERQKGDLEESTVRFIRESTSEIVDELGFRAMEERSEYGTEGADSLPGSNGKSRALVIPVRDGSDNLVSTMLSQVLDLAGFHAIAVPVRSIDETIATVNNQDPAIVFLSGMPPVAMARAHRIYRNLRAANPNLKIVVGIWNYSEDHRRAAQMISRTEDLHISTSLADAIAHAQTHVEPGPSVPKPLDSSPQLVGTPSDTAA